MYVLFLSQYFISLFCSYQPYVQQTFIAYQIENLEHCNVKQLISLKGQLCIVPLQTKQFRVLIIPGKVCQNLADFWQKQLKQQMSSTKILSFYNLFMLFVYFITCFSYYHNVNTLYIMFLIQRADLVCLFVFRPMCCGSGCWTL